MLLKHQDRAFSATHGLCSLGFAPCRVIGQLATLHQRFGRGPWSNLWQSLVQRCLILVKLLTQCCQPHVCRIKIRFVEEQPKTTWMVANPREYGFYSNVNPAVNHPRWSQATERPIGQGGGLFVKRRATQPFNGYGDQVASLYTGMDLRKYY